MQLVLYRTPRGWRTTVAGPAGTICGTLRGVMADAPFEEAEARFAATLRDGWSVAGPIRWVQDRPDWWSADTGAARAETA